MQKLVHPDRRTVICVPDSTSFEDHIVPEYHIDRELAKNLRQLLGYTAVGGPSDGPDGREPRRITGNWVLLEDAVFLQIDGSIEVVALVGKQKFMYETLKASHNVVFAFPSFQDLVSGRKPNGRRRAQS